MELEPPFFAWSRSRPNLVGAGVGSGTLDFRNWSRLKKLRLRNTGIDYQKSYYQLPNKVLFTTKCGITYTSRHNLLSNVVLFSLQHSSSRMVFITPWYSTVYIYPHFSNIVSLGMILKKIHVYSMYTCTPSSWTFFLHIEYHILVFSI